MKQLIIVILLITLAATFTGCATIFSGGRQDISVSSNPVPARVTIKTIDGVDVFNGFTPMRAILERKSNYIVIMSLEGYEDAVVMIDKDFNFWFCGNLICGGLIGMAIDAISGAAYRLTPNEIMIGLEEISLGDGGKELQLVLIQMDTENRLIRYTVPLVESLPLDSIN